MKFYCQYVYWGNPQQAWCGPCLMPAIKFSHKKYEGLRVRRNATATTCSLHLSAMALNSFGCTREVPHIPTWLIHSPPNLFYPLRLSSTGKSIERNQCSLLHYTGRSGPFLFSSSIYGYNKFKLFCKQAYELNWREVEAKLRNVPPRNCDSARQLSRPPKGSNWRLEEMFPLSSCNSVAAIEGIFECFSSRGEDEVNGNKERRRLIQGVSRILYNKAKCFTNP